MPSSPRRRIRAIRLVAPLLVVLLVSGLATVALAGGFTSRKFTASFSPSCVAPSSTVRYTATLKNDPSTSSGQYITTAFFHNPASTGISKIGSFTTPVATGGKTWFVLPDLIDADGFTLVAKNSSNGIKPGEQVTVTFSGTAASTTGTKTFSALVGGSGSFSLAAGASLPSVLVATQCPAAAFKVTDANGNPIGNQVAGTPFAVKVTALDGNNNTATGFSGTVQLTSTPTGLSGAPVSVAITNGVSASTNVTITKSGSFTLKATSGTTTGTSNAFSVAAGAATHLTVEQSDGVPIPAQTSGGPFSFQVFARDANGNIDTSFNGTAAVTSSPAGLNPISVNVTLTNGVSPSTLVSISPTGSFVLNASSGSVTGSSAAFPVTAGAATHFTVTDPNGDPIGSQSPGVAFPILVTALDAQNNVANFNGSAQLTSSPAGLNGAPVTITFSNGTSSPSVTISATGTFTLTATNGSVTGTSDGFDVADASLSCDPQSDDTSFEKSGTAGDVSLTLTDPGTCDTTVPVTIDLATQGTVNLIKPFFLGSQYTMTIAWSVEDPVNPLAATKVDYGADDPIPNRGLHDMLYCGPGGSQPTNELWCITGQTVTIDQNGDAQLTESYNGTGDPKFQRS